jgi:hypothetical protein
MRVKTKVLWCRELAFLEDKLKKKWHVIGIDQEFFVLNWLDLLQFVSDKVQK